MASAHEEAERGNERYWDELAPVHLRAYREVALLESGGSSLDASELAAIGDVRGKTLLHLQCHIGTDTLSWARAGAKVTGVDLSAASLDCARELQGRLGLDARWLHANLYDLPAKLDERFDVVYTSRGVLCWLRDLREWARIIARFLAPGGTFFLMESHPILHVFEEGASGELGFAYPYFHEKSPTRWADDGPDYADASYFPREASYEWTWSLGDILSALLAAGLRIEHYQEHERLFFRNFPGMEPVDDRWYDYPRYRGKLPLMFTLAARKPV